MGQKELSSREKLRHIQHVLDGMDLEADFQEANGDILTDVLIVPIVFGDDDESDDPPIFTLTYIPGTEEYYENVSLLQLMVELPLEVEEKSKAELFGFILRMNQQIGIGAYYIDEENKIGLRHILSHGRFGYVDESVLTDTVNLLLSMAHYTGQGVADVLNGADPEEVMEGLFG